MSLDGITLSDGRPLAKNCSGGETEAKVSGKDKSGLAGEETKTERQVLDAGKERILESSKRDGIGDSFNIKRSSYLKHQKQIVNLPLRFIHQVYSPMVP